MLQRAQFSADRRTVVGFETRFRVSRAGRLPQRSLKVRAPSGAVNGSCSRPSLRVPTGAAAPRDPCFKKGSSGLPPSNTSCFALCPVQPGISLQIQAFNSRSAQT
ncbi:hypothetical protein AAFF_G00406190 [Aldrovandia affinis]|uniref:Uncharacterized protein n=1 Tax=Aldrovandia affinis TaxID=143900 RepID=A0AAD7SCE1_9TELE|nr:hypothetical protein AAFF_G00406190 [Aldrovandia affinis]